MNIAVVNNKGQLTVLLHYWTKDYNTIEQWQGINSISIVKRCTVFHRY